MFCIKNRSISLLSLALLCIASTSLAQDAPGRWSVLTVEVKPGANAQFEEFIQAFREAAVETDSSLYWLVSQTEVGGSNNYAFHRPISSWAEVETPAGAILSEVYEDQEVERLLALYNSSAARIHTAAYLDRPDLSRAAPPMPDVVAVNYLDIGIHQGMNQQFEEFVRHLVEASEATAPSAYWEMRAPSFGARNAYRVVVAFSEWADADVVQKPIPQRLAEHYGEVRGAQILEEGNAAIESFRSSLRRTRGDLARPPIAD